MLVFLKKLAMGLLLTAMWVGSGLATELTHPATFRMINAPLYFDPGETYHLEMELVVRNPAVVSNLGFEGSSWTVSPIKKTMVESKNSRETYLLEFDLRSTDTDQPLEFSYHLDGKRVVKTFDLSRAETGKYLLQPTVETVSQKGTPGIGKGMDTSGYEVEPLPFNPNYLEDPEEKGSAPDGSVLVESRTNRQIQVTGEFFYPKNDYWLPGHGTTVWVMADTWGNDKFLGSGGVEVDGTFSIDVNWSNDPILPDIYLIFVSGNSGVSVIYDSFWEGSYSWRSQTIAGVTGNAVDFGSQGPEAKAWVVDMVGAVTKANIYYFRFGGHASIPSVDVFWPSDDGRGAHYDEGMIYFPYDHMWSNGSLLHEHGHHWLRSFLVNPETEYCNDYCEPPGCGHTAWCRENAVLAFNEGFPYWLSYSITQDWKERYGLGPTMTVNYEEIEECQNCDEQFYHWPYITEGFFSALLQDMEDPENDRDGYSPPFKDRLTMEPSDILRVALQYNPTSPHTFILAFLEEFPDKRRDFWETCANNGYDEDDVTEPYTYPLNSSSHTPSVESFNNSVDLYWSPAFDDFSGPGGYSLAVTVGYDPLVPNLVADPEIDRRAYHFTMENLLPGVYSFSIRAMDRAGNWDPNYQTFGPVIIREPDGGDLRPQVDQGDDWDFPLILKDTPTATNSTVHVDTEPLYSNCYWNASLRNYGDIATPEAGARLFIDENPEPYHWFSFHTLDSGYSFQQINEGPIYVPSGRHTTVLFVDSFWQVAEPNEMDNWYGHQWVWKPTPLSPGIAHRRSPPPLRDGGFDSVYDQLRYYNCHGLYLPTIAGGVPSPWAMVAAHNVSNDYDVDLRLHDAPSTAQDGYDISLAVSGRTEGYTDAVIVNAANRPRVSYAVGVINNDIQGSGPDYIAEVEYAQALTLGDPFDGALEIDKTIALFTFDVPGNDPIRINLQLDETFQAPPIYAAWYGADFTTGQLLDYDAVDVTDWYGSLILDINPGSGIHGLVLWRDPADRTFAHQGYTLTVGPRVADLAYFQPSAWDAPLIPANSQIVTPGNGPEPTVLIGETQGTYLNMGVVNNSPVASPSFQMGSYVDGALVDQIPVSPLPGGQDASAIATQPVTIRGGRHVLSLMADQEDVLAEPNEGDNTWGTAYVFTPITIGFEVGVLRSCPPAPTAGWNRIRNDELLFYNCDGIGTPVFYPSGNYSQWGGVAIMPGQNTDVNLRLHAPNNGAREGFDYGLARSDWVLDQSDFVLMNFHNTTRRAFQAGVVLSGANVGEDYLISTVRSAYLGDAVPVAHTGSFAANQLMDIYEMTISTSGYYTVTLDVAEPSLDLGVSLYGSDQDFYNKDEVFNQTNGAWLEPGGATESFNFRVLASDLGNFCLAVWKVAAVDAPIAGSYTLSVSQVPNLPDVAYVTPSGWDAPLVPRPAHDATNNWAPLPEVMLGDYPGTFFNFAHTSYGYTDPAYFELWVGRDLLMQERVNISASAVGYILTELGATPRTVPGGRHTLSYLVDWTDDLEELDESNNIYGVQYVWQPSNLLLNIPGYRTDPMPITNGWEFITDGSLPWYNCDAMRTPTFSPETNTAYWGCVAIIPESESNVNLRLHLPSTGISDGFTTPLVTSNFPGTNSDFVLINFNTNDERQFDAGIIVNSPADANNEEVKVVATQSVYSGQDPMGSVGDHWMRPNDLVNLYEYRFQTPGSYRVEMTPYDANCNLGISLYGGDAPYFAKVDVLDDGVHGEAVSAFSPAGEPEGFDFNIDAAGWYALAVWKIGAEDRADSTYYNLAFSYAEASGVEDGTPLPTATRLAEVFPNPFNPMTTVAFDLDATQKVRLEIFDLRGHLVRQLVDESLPAGRHERVWRGLDHSGRSVASGVYMVRMTAGQTVNMKRVSLLK